LSTRQERELNQKLAGSGEGITNTGSQLRGVIKDTIRGE